MNRALSLAMFCLFICLPPGFGSESGDAPVSPANKEVSVERLASTPDLMQSLPAAALPWGGTTYCGPVAASNTFVWLSHHGYPKLGMLGGADTPPRQGRLARKLGELMSASNGATPTCFMNGISSFVLMAGYRIRSLKYEGWEMHPQPFSTGVVRPDPEWIKAGLQKENSGVWLMIGWYKYGKANDEYHPYDQHWVTLVGYGQDKDGKIDPNILIIHDPAARSGEATSHDYIRLQQLTHGKFVGSGRSDASAKGWYLMTGDLKLKKYADVGILDGAVVLQLANPQ